MKLEHFWEQVLTTGSDGDAEPTTANVYVYIDEALTVPAALYLDSGGQNVAPNPLTPDAFGLVECYALTGYKYFVTANGKQWEWDGGRVMAGVPPQFSGGTAFPQWADLLIGPNPGYDPLNPSLSVPGAPSTPTGPAGIDFAVSNYGRRTLMRSAVVAEIVDPPEIYFFRIDFNNDDAYPYNQNGRTATANGSGAGTLLIGSYGVYLSATTGAHARGGELGHWQIVTEEAVTATASGGRHEWYTTGLSTQPSPTQKRAVAFYANGSLVVGTRPGDDAYSLPTVAVVQGIAHFKANARQGTAVKGVVIDRGDQIAIAEWDAIEIAANASQAVGSQLLTMTVEQTVAPTNRANIGRIRHWNGSAMAERVAFYSATPQTRIAGDVRVGTIQVTDGVTAPTPVAGQAIIYVDVADGDLKIAFGDSTVKTIVTDT